MMNGVQDPSKPAPVNEAVFSQILALDEGSPTPYAFSIELVQSFLKSSLDTLSNMDHVLGSGAELHTIGNGASYIKGMAAQYGVVLVEHACEALQAAAWAPAISSNISGHEQRDAVGRGVAQLRAEILAARGWFAQFYQTHGVVNIQEFQQQ